MWLATALTVAVLLAVLGVVLRVWQRFRQLRTGGVEVALRLRADDRGRGWHLGVGHYRGEEFAWYRALSLRTGPSWVLNRRDVDILTRREPSSVETYTVPSGATVLDLTGARGHIELAMGADALTGFLSWSESAPPGNAVPWAS